MSDTKTFPVCPECGKLWTYYDGALGYESLSCKFCDIDIADIEAAEDKQYYTISKRRNFFKEVTYGK